MAVDQEILQIVKDEFARGKSEDEVRAILAQSGVSGAETEELIASFKEFFYQQEQQPVVQEPSAKKPVSKGVIGAVAVVVLVAFAGAYFLFFSGSNFSGKDCGVSLEKDDDAVLCFKEEFAKCRPAKARFEQNSSSYDGLIMKYYMEVSGKSPESCDFYVKIEDVILSDKIASDPVVKAYALRKGDYFKCENISISNLVIPYEMMHISIINQLYVNSGREVDEKCGGTIFEV